MDQFPGLWSWIGAEINQGHIHMPAVAFAEVEHPADECAKWLNDNGLNRIAMTNEILLDAMRIKRLLGILDDKYGGGVGENDLFIIATARVSHAVLVSDERVQAGLPKLMANYKIPAVCGMQEVSVECISFLEFIKRSRAIF